MNRKTMPIDFRTFVVFSMISLTFLPMCSPGGEAGGTARPTERAEVSAPEDAHLPPAEERARGPERRAEKGSTTTKLA